MIFDAVVSSEWESSTCLVQDADWWWPTCCPTRRAAGTAVSPPQNSNSSDSVLGQVGCYICITSNPPFSALLTRATSKPKLDLQLLSYQTPSIQLQTLVQHFQSLVLGLAPWPPLRKFIVRHPYNFMKVFNNCNIRYKWRKILQATPFLTFWLILWRLTWFICV